jgi:hypothetical protein
MIACAACPILPTLCASHGRWPAHRARASLRIDPHLSREHVDGMPRVVATATASATHSLMRSRASARFGNNARWSGRVLAGDAASHRCRHPAFIKRFDDAANGDGAPPLSAYARVDAALAEGTRSPGREVTESNALLLLGAALDGERATTPLANAATLSATRQPAPRLRRLDLVSAPSAPILRMTRAPHRAAHQE